MTVQGQLLQMLKTVAEALGDDLRNRLIFVGGCTTALFITDPNTLEDVRATDDVDLIVDLAGYSDWTNLQEQLRRQGFFEFSEDNVICRMRLGYLKVDFMPDDESILGFSNRWYARGIETAVNYTLTSELNIKHLTPEIFVATKLEAYNGRGNNNPMESRDLEDVLLIVDGRKELVAEVQAADEDIRSFIAKQLREFQTNDEFNNFIEGNIRGPNGRIEIVRERLAALSKYNGVS